MDRQRLLQLARRALESRVQRRPLPDSDDVARSYHEAGGVFVTVRCSGELRGCLGRMPVSGPLAEAVADLAASVADSDPRFNPISAYELRHVELEISVLGRERPMTSPDEIEIGSHGLIVEQGVRRGLLLPQVAPEYGWDPQTFLTHACLKAALAPDAWRRGARAFLFEADVFSERGRRSQRGHDGH
jgi:AmmeMemoRadiSam system protein A